MTISPLLISFQLFCSTGSVRRTLPLTVLKVLASLACHGRLLLLLLLLLLLTFYIIACPVISRFVYIQSMRTESLNERGHGSRLLIGRNRRHQIQRRSQSRRVPQPGGVLVRLPAALPMCPRAPVHRAAGGHPVFRRRRKGV